ncbi:MAG: capsid assembly protein [Pseudomonadota bacterium]|nr:capsid assembly protein [Pseudomonadota bacterium]
MSNPADSSAAPLVPGSDEYNAHMASLGEQVATTSFSSNGDVQFQNTPPVDNQASIPPASPEKILGKFDTAEDLAKAYTELEKKLGAQSAPETPAVPPTEPDAQPAADPQVPAGVDLPKFQQEFAEKGELTPESYEELAKSGISKEVVDQYIEGQKALQAQAYNAAFALVGGEANYRAMMAWAATGMTKAEQASFNAAVGQQDQNIAHLAIKGLEAKYVAANGRQPANFLTGGASTSGAGNGGFASTAQVTAAISDPRYRTDSAYRREVEAKIAATPDNFFLAKQGI